MFTIFVHVARLFIVVAANQLNNNFANCCKFVKVTQSWQVKDVNNSVAQRYLFWCNTFFDYVEFCSINMLLSNIYQSHRHNEFVSQK